MKLLIEHRQKIKEPVHITVGGFDGIHRGHKELIKELAEKGKKAKAKTMVVTFNPSPIQYFTNIANTLTDIKEKCTILKETGVDYTWIIPFDENLQKQEADFFFKNNIFPYINLKGYHCGADHGIGRNRQNGIEDIKNIMNRRGIEFFHHDLKTITGEKISSSRIREYIREGAVDKAAEELGHYYFYHGRIEEGNRIGRQLGFPTANLAYKEEKVIPAAGVYWGAAKYENKIYKALIYAGRRPTINKTNHPMRVEAYLYNFEKEIYGEELTVYFIEQLRKDLIFPDKIALRHQIEIDARRARNKTLNHTFLI